MSTIMPSIDSIISDTPYGLAPLTFTQSYVWSDNTLHQAVNVDSLK